MHGRHGEAGGTKKLAAWRRGRHGEAGGLEKQPRCLQPVYFHHKLRMAGASVSVFSVRALLVNPDPLWFSGVGRS